jgi:tetratricopeptide (TPR) repeat protein
VALAQREQNAGRLAEAAEAYRKILALRPESAEAHNNLGNVLVAQSKFDDAAAHYERAVAINPSLFQAYNNLGNVFRQQGKLDQAAASLTRALAINPHFPEALNGLGNTLKDQSKLDQAVAQYERAIALRPDYAEAHNNLGSVFKDQGKLDQATSQFERAVALKPGLLQAHNNLGNILREQGKLDRAMAAFARAVAINPRYADAHNNLGNLLRQRGRFDEAAARYEQAIALKSDFAEAYSNLGSVLEDQGKLDQAVARFEQALALRPDLAEAHCNLGNTLKALGKFDQATTQYDQALALKPAFAEAHYNRANLKTFRADDADLTALETLAADPNRLPAPKMVYIHFALGKALEDIGDYSRAFAHWLKGNWLKRQEVNYDEPGYQRTCRQIAEAFDARLLSSFATAGDPSPAPIFVLGMPCSGSTLVEQILASHPQVHAAGELKILDQVVRTVPDASGRPLPYPAWTGALDADGWRRLGQAYLAKLPSPAAGKTRITDKATTNFLRVGVIRLILPNARIIHTVRNPVDTCVSCFSRLFSYGQPFCYNLAELGRYYRGYEGLMQHWRSVLPADAMLDVSYEEVVANLEQQARRLIDYCGLPWDDRCLSFHETSRSVATGSNVQVRRPLYGSSVQRWRRYESYLQPLLAELEGCRQSN